MSATRRTAGAGHRTLRGLILAACLAAAPGVVPGSADAAPWVGPDSLAPSDGAVPRALFRSGARTITVTSSFSPFTDPGDLTVASFGGPLAPRRVKIHKAVLEDAAARAGGFALLVSTGRDTHGMTQRLTVFVGSASGRLRRTWSARTRWGDAHLATGNGGRIAVLWADSAPAGPPGNVVLRLLASPDGVRFPAPRTLHGVLPGWLATVGPSYLSDTGLAFDRSGMLVVAAVVWRRPAGELITTSVTPRGRVLARQTTVGPEGLVRAMETSPSGRTAALVEDTGIEGESGECVGDGKPRKVWAALREPGARAFSTQLLESRQLICAAVSAHLALARDGRAVVLWGTASETDPPVAPTIRMAEARPGEAFGASSLAPFGPMLGDALFVPSGVLVAATLMPSNLIQPYSGRLSTVTRAIDGTLEPPLTLTSTEVHTTLLAADGRGRLALAWSDGVRVRVSVSEGA